QLGLVLEVGEDSAGRHTGTLGDVADGGGVIATLCKQVTGGFQHLDTGASLGNLATVYAGLGFGFGGRGGDNDGVGHWSGTLFTKTQEVGEGRQSAVRLSGTSIKNGDRRTWV